MKAIWAWFRGLPMIVQLILIALIIYALYNLYLYIKRKINSGNFNAAASQAQTALNQLAAQGEKPSYGQAEYTSMANALEQTFTGCGLGWSDVVVPTLEKMKSDSDIYALIVAYGVRNIPECGWGSFNGDLAATLAYKTSGLILTIANPADFFTNASISSANKILKNNGLTFQF